ncbi:MAG: MBL fold metallo-hydrolase [Burkholderiales bacterium]|nr:MBL fold metallo-hydrolase [Burkholderiales bacterium]
MRILNLGGATAIIEQGGKRMLTDPWLDDGIFHGAWYHYPPMKNSIEDVGRLDYIFISHIHEDHCSAGTIRYLNRDAELIIADRTPNFVERFLQMHGFRFAKVHKVKPREPVRIADDLLVDIVEADPANEMAYAVDSALVMNWGGTTVYNANDCQPYPDGIAYIKQHYQVDVALLPYSGGSGYPACYLNLSEAQKAERAQQILQSRLASFGRVAREIAPRWVMPFADQYVIAGSRSHLNRHVSHPPAPGVVREHFEDIPGRSELLLLNPGQSFDFETGARSPDAPYEELTADDREAYVAAHLQEKSYDHEGFELSPAVSFSRLVRYARQRLWQDQQRRKSFPEWNVYLDIDGRNERYCIDLRTPEVEDVDPAMAMDQPYLRIVMSPTLAALVLIGHISINIADAALFLDYERVPDRYDPEIYVLLNMLRC